MSADSIIELIRELSDDERDRVAELLSELRAERKNAQITAERIRELREGKVKPLTHDEVFAAARAKIREV